MKILSLYNEPVKLEVGDLIAKDDGQLWIMDGCDVYKATQPLDKKNSWLDSIKKATSKGVFVGITTQTLYGTTDPYVYAAGRLMLDSGAIFLKDMLPETAYVKLGWVLGHKE